MIRTLLSTSVVFACTQLIGCASIVSGQNQSVSVDTPGCNPASCQLSNDKGSWFVTTPGSVTVRRAYGNLMVACTKEGYTPATTSVASSTKAMAYGNVLFGGLVGAGVDAATGAAYDYPQVISVALACGPDAKIAKADPPTR
ncbi:MAG: hypothetical protein ACK499_10065 [Betaproteobacteria bacterium]